MSSTRLRPLAVLLVVNVVLAILVTPAGGMGPRPPSGASGLTWILVAIYMAGLAASVAGVVQLVRSRPSGVRLAMFAPLLHYPVIVSDRLGAFHAETAPAAIATLEWIVAASSEIVVVTAAAAANTRRHVHG